MFERLGPFKIGRVLGRGGMGAVYEGTLEEDNSHVAIKVLPDSFDEDNEARIRFETEIETLKLLCHPNIVRLTGFGAEQGQLYYVMEYIDGLSLQHELRKKRHFQWHEVARIGLDICQALRHAHDRGVIHRDIKPANILLDQDGNVKLSDYGIARFFGSQNITDNHSIIGTLEYMSPEQALAHPINPSTDLYSLGCVMFALLIGKPPFPARSLPELLRKHQTTTPMSICSVRHDVPDELGSIISDLLQILPENRPRNAFLVIKRLQSLLHSLMGDPSTIEVLPLSSGMPKPHTESVFSVSDGIPQEHNKGKSNFSDIHDRVALLPQSNDSSKHVIDAHAVVIFPSSIDPNELKESKKVTRQTETAIFSPAYTLGKVQHSESVLTETQTSYSVNSDASQPVQLDEGQENAPPVSSEQPTKSLKTPVRFTAVATRDFDPFQAEDRTVRPLLSLPVLLTSTMLMIVGLTVYYLIQPIPPEVLYARIIAAVKNDDPDGIRLAQNDIRSFVLLYADHPAAEQIRAYQDELDLSEHERRLERRMQFSALRTLSPIERTYVSILTSSLHNPEQMIDKLRAFIAVFQSVQSLDDSDKPHRFASSPVEICVELARRRLKKLEQDVDEINSEQEQVVRRRLDEAAELDSRDPARAENMRRGIVELYQQNCWAKELVEEAKHYLNVTER